MACEEVHPLRGQPKSILRQSPAPHPSFSPEIEALGAAERTIQAARLTVSSGNLGEHLVQLTRALSHDVLQAEESGVGSAAGLERACDELCLRLAELVAGNDVDGYVDALTLASASINADINQFATSEHDIQWTDVDQLRSAAAPTGGATAKSVRWPDKQPHDITVEGETLKSDQFDECRGFDALFDTLLTEIDELSSSFRKFGPGAVGSTLGRRLKVLAAKLEGMECRYNDTLPGWKSALGACSKMYRKKLEEAALQEDATSFQFFLGEMAQEVQRRKLAGNEGPAGRGPGAKDFGFAQLYGLGARVVAVATDEDARQGGRAEGVLTLSCVSLSQLYNEFLENLRVGLGGENAGDKLYELKRNRKGHFRALFQAAKKGNVERFVASLNLFFEDVAKILNGPGRHDDEIERSFAVDGQISSATTTAKPAASSSPKAPKEQAIEAVGSIFLRGLDLASANQETLASIHAQLESDISEIDAKCGSAYSGELNALRDRLIEAIQVPSGFGYAMVLDEFLTSINAS